MLTARKRFLQQKYDTARHLRRVKPLSSLSYKRWIAFCAGMFAAAATFSAAQDQALAPAPGQVVGWGFNAFFEHENFTAGPTKVNAIAAASNANPTARHVPFPGPYALDGFQTPVDVNVGK